MKHKKLNRNFVHVFLSCCLMLATYGLQAQVGDTTEVYALLKEAQETYYYGDFDKALEQTQVAHDKLMEIESASIKKKYDVKLQLAKCNIFTENTERSAAILKELYDLIQAQDELDTFYLTTTLGVQCHVYDLLGQLPLAVSKNKECLSLAKIMKPEHPKLGDFYHGAGNIYYSIGDYLTSYEYYQRAVDFYLQTKPKDHPSVLETRMAKAYTQIQNGDEKNALEEIAELITSAESKEESKTTLMALYSIQGVGYDRIGEVNGALESMKKSLVLVHELFGKENLYAVDIMQSIGELQLNADEFDAAEQTFAEAIAVCDKLGKTSHNLLGAILKSQGLLYAKMKRFDEAFAKFDAAYEIFQFDGTDNIMGVKFFNDLLLTTKGIIGTRLEAFHASDDIANLDDAYFSDAVELIDEVRQVYIHEGSKERMIEKHYGIYENALSAQAIKIDLGKDDGGIERAFSIMEKGKVQTLLDQIRQNKVTENRLDKKLITRQDSFHEALALARHEISNTEKEDDLLSENTRKYLQLKEAYENFIAEIKTENPNFFHFTMNQDVVSLQELQEKVLDDNTVLFEYFFGQKELFVLKISNEDAELFNKKIPDNILENIDMFSSQMISKGNADQEVLDSIATFIISDIWQGLSKTVKKIIVIPDGELAFIPFEILQMGDGKMLFEKYTISYASSATLLVHQQSVEREADKSFAGFAPTYRADVVIEEDTLTDQALANIMRSGNLNLPAAKQEVQEIADLLKGDMFVDSEAKEATFKSKAGEYDVLHMAMHALVNAKNPARSRLLFGLSQEAGEDDGQLYVNELYAMNLKARMAVLSACNTGGGAIKRGEGSLSIARAFAYSGVPSALMSLWEVPDKSTSHIMVEFYKNIKEGKSKDIALRNAKMNYLSDASIPDALKKPFYWAGFIATGNMEPLVKTKSSLPIWLGLFSVFLGLFVVLKSRKK